VAVSPTLKPPLLPAAAAKPTPFGAQAFFEHFVRVYTYTYNSLDTAPLKTISMDACVFCRSAITNVEKAQAAGQSIESGAVTITAIAATPLESDNGSVVSVAIDQGAVITRDRQGEVLGQSPAVRDGRLDARVVWNGDKWMVRAVKIVVKGTP
jgi:hypothetical protein